MAPNCADEAARDYCSMGGTNLRELRSETALFSSYGQAAMLQDAPQKSRIISPSYELHGRLSHRVRKLDAPKKQSKVEASLPHLSLWLDPDAVAAVTLAYDAILSELQLPHREDAGTLMVAKRLIEVAARGERGPQALADATLRVLSR
jgi:hypothetical protein